MKEDRYEIIAWDGFARWISCDAQVRKLARMAKKSLETINSINAIKIKIWDRANHAFIR